MICSSILPLLLLDCNTPTRELIGILVLGGLLGIIFTAAVLVGYLYILAHTDATIEPDWNTFRGEK